MSVPPAPESLARRALGQLARAGSGELVVRVRGDSMAPALADGCAVLVRLGRFPLPGQIAVFLARGGYVVHRVLFYEYRPGTGWCVRTAGDARAELDEEVALGEVLGVVRAVDRGEGDERLPGGLAAWFATLARLAVRGAGA